MLQSLPAWGVWIEIHLSGGTKAPSKESLPAWGVWIEIINSIGVETYVLVSLPAWGVWIEIPAPSGACTSWTGRSPHGECGLKSSTGLISPSGAVVAPRMGSVD